MRKAQIFVAAGVCAVLLLALGAWWFWRDPVAVLGGVQLTYQVDLTRPVDDDRERLLERTAEVVKRRVANLSPLGRVSVDLNQVTVRLPISMGEQDRVKRLLMRSARLEFKRIDDGGPFEKLVLSVEKAGQDGVHSDLGTWGKYSRPDPYLVSEDPNALFNVVDALTDTHPLPADREIALEPIPRDGKYHWRTHCLFRQPAVTDRDLRDVQLDFDQAGRPNVALTFTPAGARRLGALTETWIDKRIAVVFEGRIIVAPVVNTKLDQERSNLDLGVGWSRQDAGDLVAILRAGSLPAPLVLVEERAIGGR